MPSPPQPDGVESDYSHPPAVYLIVMIAVMVLIRSKMIPNRSRTTEILKIYALASIPSKLDHEIDSHPKLRHILQSKQLYNHNPLHQ